MRKRAIVSSSPEFEDYVDLVFETEPRPMRFAKALWEAAASPERNPVHFDSGFYYYCWIHGMLKGRVINGDGS